MLEYTSNHSLPVAHHLSLVAGRAPDANAVGALLPPSGTAPKRLKSASRRIAYLEDDPDFALLIRLMGKRLGHIVTTFHCPTEAMAAINLYPQGFDIFMTDYQMPLGDGAEVVQRVKRAHQHLGCAVISNDERIMSRADVRALKIATAIKPNCLQQFELLLDLIDATSN